MTRLGCASSKEEQNSLSVRHAPTATSGVGDGQSITEQRDCQHQGTGAALVVGAGPTGLLLAAELQRRGVGCRFIDAQPGPMHCDRATVVHPRSLEVFESLGIPEPFLAVGVKQRPARLHSPGSLFGELDLSSCGSRRGYKLGLSEQVTESILTDYLRHQGGEVISWYRLVTLEHHPQGRHYRHRRRQFPGASLVPVGRRLRRARQRPQRPIDDGSR